MTFKCVAGLCMALAVAGAFAGHAECQGAVCPAAGDALLQRQTLSERLAVGGFTEDVKVEPETKELQITINDASDVENMGFKIIEAMQQANMILSQWVPVLGGSQSLTDKDTYPEIYTITMSRSDAWALDQERFETLEEHNAYLEALAETEREAQEAEQFDPAANESSAPPSLLTTSVKEMRAYLLQLHTDRFGTLSPEERSAARVGEVFVQVGVNGSELSDEAVFMSLQGAKKIKKKKNSKQLSWAARAISKLESEVCTRSIQNKPLARMRRARHYRWYADPLPHATCDGWEDIGGVCWENCAANEVGHYFACHYGCDGWEDTGTTCNERCNLPELSHIGSTCGLGYCSKDTGACGAKIAKLAVTFLEALANFIPGGKALTALKAAAKAGTKAAIKKAIKKAVKSVAKDLISDAKNNLKKYMKSEGKTLNSELRDSLLEGGAEAAAETMIAKSESGSLREAAEELVMAVDPTGVSGIINEFQADSCSSKKIEPMPESGLITQVCPDSVTLSGAEDKQSTRMGTFEYTGEDNHERPIYLNDHNQFLYFYQNVGWLVGSDTTSNNCGVVVRLTDDCPPSSQWEHWTGKAWVSSPSIRKG